MSRRGRQHALLPETALNAVIHVDAAAGAYDMLLAGCPVQVDQLGTAAEAGATIQMANWQQMPQVLAWFAGHLLPLDGSARLTFAACLPKELRADVHKCVSKKHGKVAETVSEGFGDDRHVAVLAKSSSRKARMMTLEQADHALALWLLHKEHSKRLQQQHQQQTPAETALQQQQQQQQPYENDPEDPELMEKLKQLDVSGNRQHQQEAELLSAITAPELHHDEAAASSVSNIGGSSNEPSAAVRVYSRDEVAQMLQQDKLTDDLAALWSGPAGQAQRHMRLLCLAASAGDEEEVQELLSVSQPGLLAGSVRDLSSGGQLPLHLAAAAGNLEVMRLLIAAGASLEAVNGAGHTALQVAQRCEQCDAEAVLLQAGAINKQQDSWSDFTA